MRFRLTRKNWLATLWFRCGEAKMTSRAAVFDLIKTDGPITAKISDRLTIGEKIARNHIDALRASGEAIWYDPQTAGFWWRDGLRPGLEAYQRWKRPFDSSPARRITAGSPPSQKRERSLGPNSGARLAISESTWSRLVDANERLVRAGLAQPGVFATAVGPQYQAGSSRSLLYVGKSPGPKANLVGSVHDQAASCRASTEWMMRFKNQSPFWQFIAQVRLTRAEIAWTNVCKMDRTTGGPPPAGRVWQTIAAPCLAALGEELE